MQGTTPGQRRRGRPNVHWHDNIMKWTELSEDPPKREQNGERLIMKRSALGSKKTEQQQPHGHQRQTTPTSIVSTLYHRVTNRNAIAVTTSALQWLKLCIKTWRTGRGLGYVKLHFGSRPTLVCFKPSATPRPKWSIFCLRRCQACKVSSRSGNISGQRHVHAWRLTCRGLYPVVLHVCDRYAASVVPSVSQFYSLSSASWCCRA